MMQIDRYEFGHIEIDGDAYDKDLIIVGGRVMPNWWREQGHSLSLKDLKPVIEAGPSCLIVGCGAHGQMKVPQQTRQALAELGIQVETYPTDEAVRQFNLKNPGDDVAAALHLTC